jgi:hypothetical protein
MVLGAADQSDLTLNSSVRVFSPLMDAWPQSVDTALGAALGTATTSVQTISGPTAASGPDLNPSRGADAGGADLRGREADWGGLDGVNVGSGLQI